MLIVSGYTEGEGLDPELPELTKPFRRDEMETCLLSITTLHRQLKLTFVSF